jgi:ABC-type lipoprotein release transport system permease subunit
VIAISSVSLGLALVLWMNCLMAGRNKNVIEKITSSYTGNLQIMRKDYFKDKIISQDFEALTNVENHLPAGSHVTFRTHLPSLISSGEQSLPILLVGINPERESQITNFKSNLIKGSYLAPDPEGQEDCIDKQIYISDAISKLLNVQINNKVVILAQAADGSFGNDLLRVKGIFDSKSSDFDKKFAFTTLGCVKRIGAINNIHEMIIKLENPTADKSVQINLESKLDPKFIVTTWRETLPSIASLVKFNDAIILMISSMLFIVITFGIINALLMNIFERTKEFGVMLALGTTPFKLWLMIIFECLMIGLFASFFGTILGLIMVSYHKVHGFDLSPFLGEKSFAGDFYLDLIIYPIFYFGSYVKSVLVTILIVIISGLYPAYRATKLNPVDTMKV